MIGFKPEDFEDFKFRPRNKEHQKLFMKAVTARCNVILPKIKKQWLKDLLKDAPIAFKTGGFIVVNIDTWNECKNDSPYYKLIKAG